MAKNMKLPETADSIPLSPAPNGTNGATGRYLSPTLAQSPSRQLPGFRPPQEAPTDEHHPLGDTPYDPPADRHASAYAVALGQLDRVADFMHLDDDMRVYLSTCQRELIVHFPVQMDDGKVRMFTGFRVHHNATKGPGQGRHPLSPRRDAGRVPGLGHVDDLEMRADEPALRRRQGRRDRRTHEP